MQLQRFSILSIEINKAETDYVQPRPIDGQEQFHFLGYTSQKEGGNQDIFSVIKTIFSAISDQKIELYRYCSHIENEISVYDNN